MAASEKALVTVCAVDECRWLLGEKMSNVAWKDLQAEDVGTTPARLLDMLKRMREALDSETCRYEAMAPFIKKMLDQKIEQIKNSIDTISG